ncbi:MAG TPA: HEAT repeat domain-containing protein, partial [Pirellulales bacterium]|nr:HEAT repeat domain-containing protein [Pirellulales bacterium]
VLTLGTAIVALAAVSVRAADAPKTPPGKEPELLAVLRSDAPKSEKAITCKRLAVYGSSESVPELAKLLRDEQLASWARIALEAIPGSASDEALRKALDSLQGKLAVGAINSIGVRRDAYAVDALAARLKDADVEVASAAAVALGHIGGPSATPVLRRSLAGAPAKVRSAIAEGLVLCAERSLAEGRDAEAIEIFDEVRKAQVPKQRILEATRGAILARKEKGIALLLESLRSPEKALFQLALTTAREFPGRQIDEALAGELSSLSPDRAALVIQAMADRKETVVLPAVLHAAGSGPKEVRTAAIAALGRVGNASCVSTLLDAAVQSDPDLVQAAKAALADIPGDAIDRDIVARLAQAQGKTYALLIEVVGERRLNAVPELSKALGNSDPAIRAAALRSLGETVGPKDLNLLISEVVAPKHAEDAAAAQQALKAASIRMPDREACAQQLAAALEKCPAATKPTLLEILGAVGGTKALAVLGTTAKSGDDRLQDVSSRLLGEWMTIDAAPVLLDLVRTAPGDKYQARALRGYIRIARQFTMSPQERDAMCRAAYDACRQPAEQKLVLEVLKRYPSEETLKLAVQAAEVPPLKDDAVAAVLAIGKKLPGHEKEIRAALDKAGVKKVNVEIVKAEYGAGSKQKDVTAALRKQVVGVPLISLPAPDYNTAFGGDPASGTPKKLKIQYRINGKAGEATFDENAPILLPLPK